MIAFIGFGTFGKQIYSLAKISSEDEIVIFDDFEDRSHSFVVRPFDAFAVALEGASESTQIYLGLGYKHLPLRESILDLVESHDVVAPPVIHESTIIACSATMESAVYVYPGAVIDENVVIRAGAILNNRVTISHDSVIGQCTFLAPGVVVCGDVHIGRRTFVGAGSVVTNGIIIGDDVTIGAGTVVTESVESGMTVVGNPLRYLDHKLSIN